MGDNKFLAEEFVLIKIVQLWNEKTIATLKMIDVSNVF